MYRVLMTCPQSTPKGALLWDLGGILMKHRINSKKLNFIFHIINMDKSSLSSQVYELQEKLNLPGLVRECKEIIKDLNLPNIFQVKMSKYQWKEKVKSAIKTQR